MMKVILSKLYNKEQIKEINMEKLKIEYVPLDALTPYENNAREHQEFDVAKIKKSIQEFGFNDPIGVWGKKNYIVEGHGRLLAAKELGLKEVPIIHLDHLDDEQRKAYALAHNRTAELSTWDFDKLQSELEELSDSFDFDALGFSEFLNDEEELETQEDDFNEEDYISEEPKSKRGDIYQLGNHRLMCGDATSIEDVKVLTREREMDMILTDPPYNVNYSANETREGIENDNFATDEEAAEKLWLPAFENYKTIAKDCCSYICFMPQGGTHMMIMMMMWHQAGWQVKHEFIWKKQSPVMNRADVNYQHEPMLVGWNKTHKFYGMGKYRNTSIWEFDRPTKSKEHPTMKPLDLLGECLLNYTQKGDSVCDLFGGSGSTLIACEQLNRTCFMMEYDPKYVDVIIARWEKLTGQKAIKLN